MAVPTIDASATGAETSAVTSHDVAFNGDNKGKGVAIFFTGDPGTVTPPSGFSLIKEGESGGSQIVYAAWISSDAPTTDSNVTVTTANSVVSTHIWDVYGNDDVANAVVPDFASNSSGDAPDPPASGTLTLGDYVIRAFYGWMRTRAHDSYPTNYDEDQQLETGVNPRSAGAADSLTAITSEDPGVAGISGNAEWVALTVAIPEAPAAGDPRLVGRVVHFDFETPVKTIESGV